ncbi:MAG: cyclic nucleotide-binding domain-containing protein [Candidatus Hydrogenedentota bacterium]
MGDARRYQEYARKIKLFNGLDPDDVSEILHQGSKLEYRAGDSIFFQGQMGANIFIVLHGMVDISIDGTVIAKCRPGDAFGEMSALNHRPHCASAEAASDCKLFTLYEKDINRILKSQVAVRLLLNIIHVLSSHLENANRINTKNSELIKSIQHSASQIT